MGLIACQGGRGRARVVCCLLYPTLSVPPGPLEQLPVTHLLAELPLYRVRGLFFLPTQEGQAACGIG